MPVRIRLAKLGRRHCPHYALTVANSFSPRDGRHLERVGQVCMVPDRLGRLVVEVDGERVRWWIGRGAQPTPRVAVLLGKVGVAVSLG